MLSATMLSPRAQWSRRFLSAFVPLAMLALLASLWLWRNEREQNLLNLAQRTDLQLAASQRDIANALTESAVDLMLLSNDPAVRLLVGKAPAQWGEQSEQFLNLLAYKSIYAQARLLDLRGRERLRIRLAGGEPYQVNSEGLQDSHDSEYFIEGVGLARGQIYLSALELNRDRGQLEKPYRPTMRLATPMFDVDGNKRGVLVLDLVANQLFERLRAGAPEGSRLSLVDSRGQWLAGGREEDNFSLLTRTGRTLPERSPSVWAKMASGISGHFLDDGGLWNYRRVQPADPAKRPESSRLKLPFVTVDRALDWILLSEHDEDALQPNLADAQRLSLLFGGGALALALVGAILLATQAIRGEAKLAREQIFLGLLEQAPLGVMVLDQAGEGYFFSRNWLNLTALSASLARGHGWWSLFEPADQERMQAALAELAAGQVPPRLEMQLRRADGSRRWVVCMFSAGPGAMLKAIACIISFADIQASKDHAARLATALKLVQGVLDGSGDPILAIDAQMRVSLANPALGQTFGSLYRDAPEPGDQLFDWMARFPTDQGNLLTQFGNALQGKHGQLRLTLGPMRRLFDASFAPLRDDSGELNGAILFARDVTDMARIQARVARSEELFRAVFNGSLDAVFVMEVVKNEAGRIVDFSYVEANQQALAVVNASREYFLGRLLSEIQPLSYELGYFDRYVRSIERGEPFVEEAYLDYLGVVPGWYENRVVPMGWGVTLTSRNITARKQAELVLASNEALQRNIFDSSPYAIVAVGIDGLITLFNKAAEQMLGYSAAELVGRHTPTLFHDNTELARYALELGEQLGETVEPNMQMFMLAARHEPLVREWTYLHREGRRIPVKLTLSVRLDGSGKPAGSMGIAYDVSEQRQVEEERDRLHAVVEALPDMVSMASLDERLIYINLAGRRMRGIAPDEDLVDVHAKRGCTDWSYQLISNIAVPQALAGQPWQGDTQWQLPDGQIIDTRQLLVAPRMNGREPSFTATITHDLSEMRAMEAKMVEEDALLNSILESVQDAIVVINERAEVQALNPAVADLFGYGLHRVMGKPVAMLLPDALADKHTQAFARYIATGEHGSQVIGQRREILGQRQDGSTFPLELTVSEIQLGSKRLFTWVMRDISERKAFEERLLENIDEMRVTQQALNAANEQLLRANTDLGRMAQQDGLTGVANRRAFDQRFAIEWSRAVRMNHPLALLMIDVDHFKKYNDGYGHQLGDECLRKVAQILQASVPRASDFAARYGGEEFVILLPETEADGGLSVAARIRQGLADATIPHAFSPTHAYLTASVGIAAVIPQPGMAADFLLAAADQALYQAKKAGRDRAVVSEQGPGGA
ncbi:PAS domain S-box protein [Chitinimonas arctica]|uniref:PAS domain S-box protein n=1 Tax=Chitinimonas arctica TaxID=2594795 RepID=A0A516SB41_9NEIS|nr:PAS domain S-box protein [Chitinimonas arctica]QDQ25364.1 PAS domain S-box protein [Chitinimonas arctica]